MAQRSRWSCLLLVTALVVAQALGLMHRVVHSTPAQAGGHLLVAQSHDAPGAWVERLFESHGAEACPLLDGAAAGLAFAAPAVAPAVQPAFVPPAWRGDAPATRASAACARGPPPASSLS